MEQQYDQEQMDRLVKEFYEVYQASQRERFGDFTASDAFIAAAPEAYRSELHAHFCAEMALVLTAGYLRYGTEKDLRAGRSTPAFAKFESELALMSRDDKYYELYCIWAEVLRGRAAHILPRLTAWLGAELKRAREKDMPFLSTEFICLLLRPLKEGVPGMWTAIGELMREGGAEKGLTELCFALEKVYYSADNDEIIDALLAALRANEGMHLVRELLGYIYYNMKMWSNALAWFEQLEDADALRILFFQDDELFWMAWCYGKQKNYAQEEAYYRQILELWPKKPYALNNLGYSLYRQKKYAEAKEVFQRCIQEDRDARYAANNLVRTLLAMGDGSGAREFIANSGFHIYKSLAAKAEHAPDHVPAPPPETEDEPSEPAEAAPARNIGVKKQQFSSEKLLEDELTARMEAGLPTFGMRLHVYRKRGVYGRQFVLPSGRMDILAQDDRGDFYVIELKKDAGYDDVYRQTREYMDWAEKHLARDGQRVFGVICLNGPTPKLLRQVRQDPQMRLFEYSISYSERK